MDSDSNKGKLQNSAPLPPMCEQYLDFETLGSEVAREVVVEHFTETFRNYQGPNKTTTPRTYARKLVGSFDQVTINLLKTAYERELIPFRAFTKIRLNELLGLRARNYALLQIAIRDLEARSGSFRQFDGLHTLERDEQGRRLVLDLSTDEQYRSAVACMRYAVKVTNGMEMLEGEALFHSRSGADELIVHPEVAEILRSRPEQADLIADIVIERGSQDAGVILQILDGTVAQSLSSGAL
jgi:hypothetical protein